MTQVIASLLLLGRLSCPVSADVSVPGQDSLAGFNLSDYQAKHQPASADPIEFPGELPSFTLVPQPRIMGLTGSRSYILAQMSRDEHERLRLELRQRANPDGSIGPLDTLIASPFLRSGLTYRERQRLREQLRQQREVARQGGELSPAAQVRPAAQFNATGTGDSLVPAAGPGSGESASAAPAVVGVDGVPVIIKPER